MVLGEKAVVDFSTSPGLQTGNLKECHFELYIGSEISVVLLEW